MIARYYGRHFSLQTLRDRSYLARDGVSMLGIADAAESIGIKSLGAALTWDKLRKEAPLPLIAHWKQNHFVVVRKIKRNKVYVADPQLGLLKYSKQEFLKGWISTKREGKKKVWFCCCNLHRTFTNRKVKTGKEKGWASFANICTRIKS